MVVYAADVGLPAIGELDVPFGERLELVAHVHEDELAHILYSNVGEADEVEGLHDQPVADSAILEVPLLFQIEFYVIGRRIRRVAMFLSLTEKISWLTHWRSLDLVFISFDFNHLTLRCSVDLDEALVIHFVRRLGLWHVFFPGIFGLAVLHFLSL